MTLTKIKNCFDGPLTDLSDNELYDYFIKNIYNGNLKIYGKNIKIFTTPIEDNKIQGFFHLTTKTQKQFDFKIRMREPRAYYINHIAPMIINFNNCNSCENNNCEKIKIWNAPYKNTKRTKLLFSNKNYSYIIILEENKKDMYIVTSYLINEKGYLDKVLKEYKKYKKLPK